MHGGHFRHVPAANVLVERTPRMIVIEHCAGPTRATKQHKTHHTNKKIEARSEFKKVLGRIRKVKRARQVKIKGTRHVKGLRPWAVVVAHDPCTRNPSGDR